MKCYKCEKEQDFLMRGMCPACYKSNNTPANGDPISQVMDAISTELVKDPDRLTRVPSCNWEQEDDWDHSGQWNTDCGMSWSMTEGTPKENGMRFCAGCGKALVEVPFVREVEEE